MSGVGMELANQAAFDEAHKARLDNVCRLVAAKQAVVEAAKAFTEAKEIRGVRRQPRTHERLMLAVQELRRIEADCA